MSLAKMMSLLIPLLLVLTGIAIYAFYRIHSISLPIPQALGLFTVFLPLITGISSRGANGLIQRAAKNGQERLTIPLIAVIVFQLVYETVIATLALTYILPPSSLNCGLTEKWQQLYVRRNENAVKNIQNAFECCGFRTVKDRAWPFTDQSTSPCAVTLGRTKSCAGDWRKAEQVTASLFLSVAIVVIAITVLVLISLLTNQSRWSGWPKRRDVESAAERRVGTRRLIDSGGSDESYHDQPFAAQESSTNQDQGPILAPSFLQNESDNAWRGEGEGEGASFRT